MVSEQRDRTSVLDHGYVQLVDSWGSDERIIEAARMSTAKGFNGWGSPAFWRDDTTEDGSKATLHPAVVGDEKLLRYLYEHKHMTPFEMAGMTIEVQAPIFVFREWHRHRTQSYNEMSARYGPLPNVNYVPTVERCLISGGTNKQAQGSKVLHENEAKTFIRDLTRSYADAEAQYQIALLAGVPKELARLIVPVGRYSRMRASANLRNWLAFLTLRMDAGAQWEIRQYANVVAKLIETLFPHTYALFAEHK